MKGTTNNSIRGIEVTAPINTKLIASLPLPWISISCPGRTERNDSSSVAPVNIEGMKSSIVWVIAKETIKAINEFIERNEKNDKFPTRIAVIVLMWIPGVIPVIVPIMSPATIARTKSNIPIYVDWVFIF